MSASGSPQKDVSSQMPKMSSPSAPTVSPSVAGSFIDCRNVYQLSGVGVSSTNQQGTPPSQSPQDVVKIRFRRDVSGSGVAVANRSIVTTANINAVQPTAEGNNRTFQDTNSNFKPSPNISSLIKTQDSRTTASKRKDVKRLIIKKPPATKAALGQMRRHSVLPRQTSSKFTKTPVSFTDKTEPKTTPQKLNINLAQLKTAQNKIVLVKMLTPMPHNGPKIVAAPSPSPTKSSVSPTTIALARSVQGLRPIQTVGSPPNLAALSPAVAVPPGEAPILQPEVGKSESLSSLSSSTLTTTLSTTSTTSSSSSDMGKYNITFGSEESTLDDKIEIKNSSKSNATETETHHDDNETVHSGRMSREMRCLKEMQSSSKILTEFMQSSSEKLRKRCRSESRSCGSLTPTSQVRFSVSGHDDGEELDDKDGSPSGGSAKRPGMRSANVEFSLKQRKFLSSIHQNSDASDGSENEEARQASSSKEGVAVKPRENYGSHLPVAPKLGWDKFCWRCKTCEPGLEACAGCIRCFHPVCLKLNPAFFIVEKKWNCPECIKLQSIEDDFREGNKTGKDKLKIESLTVSLKFAMKRMQLLKGSAIWNPLDRQQLPNYDHYVTNHLDLTMLQKNVADQKYKTTEAFQIDVSWILHNASIYPNNSKLLSAAKGIMKICKQEMNEIEACNECYFNANTCKTWFTEVCSRPHLLVWAKLKGFPYWPAKVMTINSNQLVDVRFFGDHDRAWVPVKDCFLFCVDDPNTKNQRRTNMAECMREADSYIAKLRKKFGQFQYADFRVPLDANKMDSHLESMIPGILRKIAENGDSHRTKLMLKIIKTADNFLSVSPVSSNAPTFTTETTPRSSRSESFDKKQKFSISPIAKSYDASTSPKQNCEETKNETQNIITPPEGEITPVTGRMYPIRKRKSTEESPNVEDTPKVTPTITQRPIKKRNSRTSTNSNASTEIKGCHEPSKAEASVVAKTAPSRKRKSISPIGEGSTKNAPKQSKIESVVLQRESDSWKTVPATKKQKTDSKSLDEKGDIQEETEKKALDSKIEEPVQKEDTEGPNDSTEVESVIGIIKPTFTESNVTLKNMKKTEAEEESVTPTIAKSNVSVTETSKEENYNAPKVPKPIEDKRLDKQPSVLLNAVEIKTEPAEEESAPTVGAAVSTNVQIPPKTIASLNFAQTPQATSNISANSLPLAPPTQQLLPIKLEPLSDDEASSHNDEATGPVAMSNTAPSSQTVVIRTNNRIMVKDIHKLTNQIGTRSAANHGHLNANGGQPVVVTPVEKQKALPKVITRQPPMTIVQQQQKQMRKSLVNAQSIQANKPQNPATPVAVSYSGNKNGHNVMHMVHIPSPLGPATTSRESSSQSTTVNTTRVTSQALVSLPKIANVGTMQHSAAPAAAIATPMQQQAATVVPPAGVSAAVLPTQAQQPVVATPPQLTTTTMTTVEEQQQQQQPEESGQHMMAGFITPSLAAAVTETIVSAPPKMQSRPSGALRSEGDCVYPSGAGPVSQILINNSYKMADFFRSVIEDTLADLSSNSGTLEAKVKVLELEIEKLKHCHQQELAKLKHNSDLVLCEMRKNMEVERTRLVNEVRQQCEIERIRSVEQAKKKQWCTNCGKEAMFYCCWNTSYCDYPCQQKHWPTHMNSCNQSQFNLPSSAIASKPQATNVISNAKVANQPQQQQVTTPKITTVQTLNMNGRSGLTIQPASVAAQQQHQQQLIITSTRGGSQLGKGQGFQRMR
ncbi:MYND-type zinc finger-containing chromatin reader Zmynd8 isoform X2 [Uranotaenia lowii]|uniref:MYND-type zinc finger-containing chromatin reader Zmynd8 isoform X2 n=1 Tax=Uranotaenia lowii TaxID=190385 RepID=UPI00247964D3|nr:MYND-type zinc finger-containing chromatin reader Zmynd8 isoform X2 [Uranotaenia lowii]